MRDFQGRVCATASRRHRAPGRTNILRGFDEQRTIKVVGRVVKGVVGGVELAHTLKQFGLALKPVGTEARHSLLGRTGYAVKWYVGRHYLRHALFELVYHHLRHHTVVRTRNEAAIVAIRHGGFDAQAGRRAINVAHRLVKYKEQ